MISPIDIKVIRDSIPVPQYPIFGSDSDRDAWRQATIDRLNAIEKMWADEAAKLFPKVPSNLFTLCYNKAMDEVSSRDDYNELYEELRNNIIFAEEVLSLDLS